MVDVEEGFLCYGESNLKTSKEREGREKAEQELTFRCLGLGSGWQDRPDLAEKAVVGADLRIFGGEGFEF